MEKAKFTIGVDVSRNTLDVYCIEVKQHLHITNARLASGNSAAFAKHRVLTCIRASLYWNTPAGTSTDGYNSCRPRRSLMFVSPGWPSNAHWGL